ncbi:hypothetical protein B0H14DRAFT_2587583 [Mycena olivaceomarginata]|nr:hypothetical protein B0H14DRAFT_2587583 [Mycena olivaceomarginata]
MNIAQDLCSTVSQMEAANHVDLLTRLRPDVETYIRFIPLVLRPADSDRARLRLLEDASKFLDAYDGLGGVHRWAARKQLGGELTALEKEINSFGDRFKTNRLVDLA